MFWPPLTKEHFLLSGPKSFLSQCSGLGNSKPFFSGNVCKVWEVCQCGLIWDVLTIRKEKQMQMYILMRETNKKCNPEYLLPLRSWWLLQVIYLASVAVFPFKTIESSKEQCCDITFCFLFCIAQKAQKQGHPMSPQRITATNPWKSHNNKRALSWDNFEIKKRHYALCAQLYSILYL